MKLRYTAILLIWCFLRQNFFNDGMKSEEPFILSISCLKLIDPIQIFKYKNSKLTPSYSKELKVSLIQLLEEEKVYKLNNISMAMLSERLGTTRHNTSQLINEHFDMNFFELINKYRIAEALEILKKDANTNLNMIDVAYEVGFNNKVTFNKSFKKHVLSTPTQFLKSLDLGIK